MPRKKPVSRQASEVAELRRRVADLETWHLQWEQSDDAVAGERAGARAILETAPFSILIVDREGHILWANGQLERTFGYSRSELIGQPVENLVPERLRTAHAGHRVGFFAEPRVRPMGLGLDLAAVHKDGREIPIEISLSFVKAEEGLLALSFITDITPRRDTERRLQAAFAVTRVFEESPPIAELVPHLLQAICESLGWALAEFWRLDGNLLRREISYHRPDLADLDLPAFEPAGREAAMAPGIGWPGRVWAAGHALWIEEADADTSVPGASVVTAPGLRAACGFVVRSRQRVTGVVLLRDLQRRERDEPLLAMLDDIGRRIGQQLDLRHSQAELVRQRDVLFQSEKLAALGRLVAGVAHEMNNPLGIISSRIELMLADAEGQGLPIQHLEDLRVVHRNTLRVARVAQALRSFARQSTGERRPVNLNTVVEETLLLSGKPTSTENIHVTSVLDPTLPPVLGDANALQQVLLNLLTNAREALTTGGEIRIETGPVPERPGWVRVAIADTGSGIASTDLPHLFEPFFTTKATGTGLGLSISYGIVQDHQGTIEVQSSPGEGTTFTLAFPVLTRA